MDNENQTSKGFGFATFATPDMAEIAVTLFTGTQLSDRTLYLRHKGENLKNSVDKDVDKVLHVRNVRRKVSGSSILEGRRLSGFKLLDPCFNDFNASNSMS